MKTSMIAFVVASFAGAAASAQVLTITSAAAADIQLVAGPNAGEVLVQKAPGIADGTLFTGITSVSIQLGEGLDQIDIQAFGDSRTSYTINTGNGGANVNYLSDLSGVVAPVSFNLTGGVGVETVKIETFGSVQPAMVISPLSGLAEVNFTADIPSVAGVFTSNFRVIGGQPGDYIVNAVGLTDTARINLAWNIAGGTGSNTIKTELNSPNTSTRLGGFVTLTGGAGQDLLETKFAGAANTVAMNLTSNGGGSNDTINMLFDQTAPASMRLNVRSQGDAPGTAGQDNFTFDLIAPGSTLALNAVVSGGEGNDQITMKTEALTTGTVSFNGNNGNDIVSYDTKGGFTGSVNLTGSNGDDFLNLFANGPFAGPSTLNGGAGFDFGFSSAPGTVFLGVEVIN